MMKEINVQLNIDQGLLDTVLFTQVVNRILAGLSYFKLQWNRDPSNIIISNRMFQEMKTNIEFPRHVKIDFNTEGKRVFRMCGIPVVIDYDSDRDYISLGMEV